MVNKKDLQNYIQYARVAYADKNNKFYPGGFLRGVHKDYFTYCDANRKRYKVPYDQTSRVWCSIYAEVACFIYQQKIDFSYHLGEIELDWYDKEFRAEMIKIKQCFFCEDWTIYPKCVLEEDKALIVYDRGYTNVKKPIDFVGTSPFYDVIALHKKSLNKAVIRFQIRMAEAICFPVEIWIRILSYLPVRDLVRTGRTSRFLFNLIRETEWDRTIEFSDSKAIDVLSRYRFTCYHIINSDITDDHLFLLRTCQNLILDNCRKISSYGLSLLEKKPKVINCPIDSDSSEE